MTVLMNTSTLCVTTQRRLDRHEPGGYWFRLAEYGDMAEFIAACARCFPDEPAPQLRFPEWSDIPDELVREDWLAPDLFEALEALSEIDERDRDAFLAWCRCNGHDIALDDVAELISRYHSLHGDYSEPEEEPPDDEDDPYASDDRLSDLRRYATELFDDEYD